MTRSAPAPARRLAFLFASILSAAWLVAGAAQADPRVLAKVDGAPITEDDVADALPDIGPGLPQKLEGPSAQKYVLDYLIDLRLAASKAQGRQARPGRRFRAPARLLPRQAGDGVAAEPRRQGGGDRRGRAQGL